MDDVTCIRCYNDLVNCECGWEDTCPFCQSFNCECEDPFAEE